MFLVSFGDYFQDSSCLHHICFYVYIICLSGTWLSNLICSFINFCIRHSLSVTFLHPLGFRLFFILLQINQLSTQGRGGEGLIDFYHTGRNLFYNSWKDDFGKLHMHCSEFHQWLIHLHTHPGVYLPYSLVPDLQFSWNCESFSVPRWSYPS